MKIFTNKFDRGIVIRVFALLTLVCSLVSFPQQADAQVISYPAEINKEFSPISITSGGVSRLSITIFNPNLFQVTDAAWMDNLVGIQPGISIANPVNLANTCGGTVVAPAGGTSLSLSGGVVPPQTGTAPGSCTVSIDVTSTTPGNLINTIPAGGLTGSGGGGIITNTTPASATLRVDAILPPDIDKSFDPNTMWVGEVSQLTITIRNTDSASALTQASLTDNLPANVILANPVSATLTGCGASASLTAVNGTGVVTLNNATIAPQSVCRITVNVTSTVSGAYVNTIPAGALQNAQGATNTSPASAPLNVQGIGVEKSFSPEGFQAGGTTTLTITLQNPTSSPLTGVNVSDVLPGTTLTVVPGSASTTCGGTASAVLPRTVTLTGGTIPPGTPANPGTCTITVEVTAPAGSFANTFVNTIPAGAITTDQGITNVLPAEASVYIYAFGEGVIANKSFEPDTIEPGGTSLLTIFVTAPVDTDLTNFSVTDNLPAGVFVSNPPAPTRSGCGASSVLTAVDGAASISLSGGVILAGATCQINVYVTGDLAGVYTNVINPDDITNDEGRSISSPVFADLTIRPISNFFVEKNFSPDTVGPNGISTLTITLRNENASPLIDVSLSDTLPGGTVNGVVIAPIPNATTNCGSGIVSAPPGGKTISMTGGTIPAQVAGVPGICTIRVDVQGLGIASTRTNIIPTTNVTATLQGTGLTINPMEDATAQLRITDLTIGIVKGFNPLTVFGGSASTMSIQLVNPNNADLVGITFTDNMPTGMIVANPANPTVGTCGGSITATPGDGFFTFNGGNLPPFGTCTLTISITMTVNGNLTNVIPADAVTTSNGARNPQPAEASLTNLPGASVGKSFSPNPINIGEYSLLTIVIQNTGNVPITGMGLVDNLPGNPPAGLEIAGSPAPAPANTCGGTLTAVPGTQLIQLTNGTLPESSSCTIVVAVTGGMAGSYENIIPAGALTSNEGATNNAPAIDTLVINDSTVTTASIGNYVWFDEDADGIQDVGETGVDGVTVNLYASDGTLIATTVTSNGGFYLFENLPPGDYYLEFIPPTGYAISPQDQGGNDETDSDITPITGLTIVTTLVAGENDMSWDAGLYLPQSPGGLTKTISGTSLTSTTGANTAIGEIVTYQVSVDVPPGTFANARLVDTMDRGLAFVECVSIDAPGLTTDVAGLFTQICATPTTDDAGGATPMDVDRQVTFNFGTLVNNGQSDTVLTITYNVIVLDIGTNVDGATRINAANWSWSDGSIGPAQAGVAIVEPELQIQKASNVNVISEGAEVIFTLAISHTADSATDAYDVAVTDILPTGLDFVANSLDCTSGAQDPDVECTYDAVTRTIRAEWSVFTRNGGNGQIQFRVVGNAPLPANGVTNTANVEWTSMPGDQTAPNSYSEPPNQFATERYYDPADLVNLYGDSDSIALSPPGGGGGNESPPKEQSTSATGSGFLIPVTGFAPNVVTDMSRVPYKTYADTSISLEIPSLSVYIPIAGVPQAGGTWDVSWLGNQAGWLEGSAFPSWNGNSVLTSHVYNSNGLPGPFVNLNSLKFGDQIIVHAFGQRYVFEVRTNAVVSPTDRSVMKHEERPWLTLVTCKNFNEKTNSYDNRVVVRAVLVKVTVEK